MIKLPDKKHKVQITHKEEISKDVYILSFKKSFDFTPGQIISVQLTKDSPHRLYSILSGNNNDFISILFNIKPEGYLTRKLQGLNIGDAIYVSEAFGEFLSNYQPNSICIATGTGVAPFYSMLDSGISDFTLIHGARTAPDFYFMDTFKNTLLKYIPCASKELLKSAYQGRLTSYLNETPLPTDTLYFLCGSAEMVVDVRELLIKKQVPFENIHTEIYF